MKNLLSKKIISKFIVAALIITQVALLAACGEKAPETSFGEDWLLNTYCYIKTFTAGDENTIKEAFKLARSYEEKLSKTINTSLVAELNSAPVNTGIHIGDLKYNDLVWILVKAQTFANLTEGKFDITVGNLTDIWDFNSGKGSVPKTGAVLNALKKTGSDKIKIAEDGEIIKAEDSVKIDFGAIAKGYIADRVAEFLKEQGISSAIISLGGNIICVGSKADGSDWRIGIEKPLLANDNSGALESRESIGTVKADTDCSVVTSGTYERYILDEETNPPTIYHHIIDPKTGYSADTDLVSATIIGKESMVCDALSTSCILLGAEKAEALLIEYNAQSADKYEYVLIKEDETVIASKGAELK